MLSDVAMVVNVDGNVTISGKFHAEGPRYLEFLVPWFVLGFKIMLVLDSEFMDHHWVHMPLLYKAGKTKQRTGLHRNTETRVGG